MNRRQTKVALRFVVSLVNLGCQPKRETRMQIYYIYHSKPAAVTQKTFSLLPHNEGFLCLLLSGQFLTTQFIINWMRQMRNAFSW